MKIISYAQNYEDVLLNRLFPDRPGGFYIDVGACHPVFHSVTKLFYERGWQGINIEPIPSMFELLAEARPRDVNLHMGLSILEGNLPFYEVPSAVGFSTFSQAYAESVRRVWGYEFEKRSIPVTTLADVCEQYARQTIDFLKIDVESHEREVLEGGDWVRYRPRVVLIEATRPDDWEHILSSSDYLFALFDGLNRFYVRAEDSELLPLLKVPVNLFDHFETVRVRSAHPRASSNPRGDAGPARGGPGLSSTLRRAWGPSRSAWPAGCGACRLGLRDWPRRSSAYSSSRELVNGREGKGAAGQPEGIRGVAKGWELSLPDVRRPPRFLPLEWEKRPAAC